MTEQQIDPDDQYRSRFDERELQREIEGAAEQLERNTRTLADVLVEHMERSDELQIRIASGRWIGYIVDVGPDVVRVATDAATVDIALGAVSLVRVWAAGTGTGPAVRSGHGVSFIARLRALAGANAGVVVEIGGDRLPTLVGQLRAVAESHVELATSGDEVVVVPVAAIGFLSRGR